MRAAASGWEALPASTTELDLDAQPSQDELKRIAARFPLLQRLDMSPNEEVLMHEDPDELDFSADGIHFPVLTHLSLSCVGMKSIAFTEANTPLLTALSLSSVIGECCPFHLALPRLRSLFAEHTALGERSIDAGQFGLSLSRCPLLETVDSYKFRCLGGSNYAVLPSLVSLKLHRSECTEHLDILYAPRLRAVSLQAAYDLSGFKLRNLPDATLATVERVLARRAAVEEEARAVVQAEEARWRDQTNLKALTKEARQRGWIERRDKWRVAAEAPEREMDEMGMFESGMDMDMDMHMDEEGGVEEEVLAEHLQELFEEKMSPASHGALECLGPSVEDRSLPRCTIDTSNMSGFRLGTLEPQVRGRCKVVRDDCGMGFDDDEESDDDDSGGGGGGDHGESRRESSAPVRRPPRSCSTPGGRLGLLPENTEAEPEDRTSTVTRPPRRR